MDYPHKASHSFEPMLDHPSLCRLDGCNWSAHMYGRMCGKLACDEYGLIVTADHVHSSDLVEAQFRVTREHKWK